MNKRMATGRVKWFSDQKGYGFISVDGQNKDVFVHYTQIVNEQGRKVLKQDELVEFEIVNTTKGEQANSVVRIS